MNSNFLVTVICLAYNHEKYIRDTLEGFLKQKTSFKVKYLIHDDCSTDNTKTIIEEYVNKYPHLFYPIYEIENQYSKQKGFLIDLIEQIDTKYIAFCEADDYWIDDLKLEKQIDYLEKNEKCSFVLTNGLKFDIKNNYKKPINPYKKTGIIELKDVFLEPNGLPPTASMVCRTNLLHNYPKEKLLAPVGDRPRRMYLATLGDCYYFNDITCVYRINNSNSFGGTISKDFCKSKKILDDMICFFKKFDEYTKHNYSEYIDLLIEREKCSYYLRSKSYKLVRKNVYYKEYTSFKQKIIDLIKWNMPDTMLSKIKKFIYYK